MKDTNFYAKKLLDLNEKIWRIQNFERAHVNESRVSILLEDVDESDVAGLKETIVAFKEAVKRTKEEVGSLTIQITSNDGEAKAASETLNKYLDAHEKALDELEKSAASVNFESGMGASLYAKNITIPGLVAAATDAIGVLESFLKGFEKFKSVILRALVPLSKSDDKSLADQQNVIEKLPESDKIVNKAISIYDEAAGGGILSGAKSLLKMITNPIDTAKKAIQKSSDEVESVVEKFPKFEAKPLGEATANLMLNVKVSALKGIKPQQTPTASKLQEPAKAARSAAGQAPGKEKKGANKEKAGAISQKIDKIKDEFKGIKPEDLAAALKKAGLIPEGRLLGGALGFTSAKNQNLSNEDEAKALDRWMKLAGIK